MLTTMTEDVPHDASLSSISNEKKGICIKTKEAHKLLFKHNRATLFNDFLTTS